MPRWLCGRLLGGFLGLLGRLPGPALLLGLLRVLEEARVEGLKVLHALPLLVERGLHLCAGFDFLRP